jgi:predicted alpha/beta hydrolase
MAEIDLGDGSCLHLAHWLGVEPDAVLMLHGAIENGRVFHSRSGKGLAPFLAGEGLEVGVLDLRGRGGSTPPIGRGSRHGQRDAIVEEIPAAADWLAAGRPDAMQHWVAHSWGGVLAAATLARVPRLRSRVASLTFFGAKRCVRVRNLQRRIYVDALWLGLAPWLARLFGYLPARALGTGSDDETRSSHAESAAWVRPGPWVDPVDGFDYGAALAATGVPPILAFAGGADRTLGHPDDVRDFLAECGPGSQSYRLLAASEGHCRDYGHIDMLTAPEAAGDHFPLVVDWMRRCRGAHCHG